MIFPLALQEWRCRRHRSDIAIGHAVSFLTEFTCKLCFHQIIDQINNILKFKLQCSLQ